MREIEWIPVYREMPPSGEPVYFCVIPLFHLGFASMRPPQIKFGYYESASKSWRCVGEEHVAYHDVDVLCWLSANLCSRIPKPPREQVSDDGDEIMILKGVEWEEK